MTRSGLGSSLQLFHDGFCKAIRRSLAAKVRVLTFGSRSAVSTEDSMATAA